MPHSDLSRPSISSSSEGLSPRVSFMANHTIALVTTTKTPIEIMPINCVPSDASPLLKTTAIVPQMPAKR